MQADDDNSGFMAMEGSHATAKQAGEREGHGRIWIFRFGGPSSEERDAGPSPSTPTDQVWVFKLGE